MSSHPTLRRLNIELETYGPLKGQYVAKLSFNANHADVTLTLPPETGARLLSFCKATLIDAVEESANALIFDLTTAIPDVLALPCPHPPTQP